MSVDRQARTSRQSGATAVEFALVLPLLVTLTYATFVFSYLYIVYESINYAAQQGAEAAVAVDPGLEDDYSAQICTYVNNAITQGSLRWLLGSDGTGPITIGLSYGQLTPDGAGTGPVPVATGCGSYGADTNALAVKVTYTVPPSLSLGFLPVLPTTLSGVGVVLLGSG